jgi:hypothetical protein
MKTKFFLIALALVGLALILYFQTSTALAITTTNPLCDGTPDGTGAPWETWAGRFLDGGQYCDTEGEDHGGTSGADGVDAMDFDGDCDQDIITGWEESGRYLFTSIPLSPPNRRQAVPRDITRITNSSAPMRLSSNGP